MAGFTEVMFVLLLMGLIIDTTAIARAGSMDPYWGRYTMASNTTGLKDDKTTSDGANRSGYYKHVNQKAKPSTYDGTDILSLPVLPRNPQLVGYSPLVLAEIYPRMATGKTIGIHGTIPGNSTGFTITIQTGYNPPVLGQFRLKVNFTSNETRISQEYFDETWDTVSHSKGILQRSTEFNLLILCLGNKFEIYFNHTLFDSFNHILPYKDATHLCISGDISIKNYTGTGVNIRTEDFYPTQTWLDNVQYHDNPVVPFVARLSKPLQPGRKITIRGIVPVYSAGFQINLQNNSEFIPDRVLLGLRADFSGHQHSLLLSSRDDGTWKNEQSEKTSLKAGHAFEIIITCRSDRLQIRIDGKNSAEYIHRISYQDATHLGVVGMVNITEVVGIEAPNKAENLSTPKNLLLELEKPMNSGRKFKFSTYEPEYSKDFWVTLYNGNTHVDFRFILEGGVPIFEWNTFDQGTWGKPIRYYKPTWLRRNQPLQAEIQYIKNTYRIIFYGFWSYTFPDRLPQIKATKVQFGGDGRLFYAVESKEAK